MPFGGNSKGGIRHSELQWVLLCIDLSCSVEHDFRDNNGIFSRNQRQAVFDMSTNDTLKWSHTIAPWKSLPTRTLLWNQIWEHFVDIEPLRYNYWSSRFLIYMTTKSSKNHVISSSLKALAHMDAVAPPAFELVSLGTRWICLEHCKYGSRTCK